MDPANRLRRSLLHELGTNLLPRAAAGQIVPLLMDPATKGAYSLPQRVLHPGPLPQPESVEAQYLKLHHWPSLSLVSKPFHYLGCVLDGPAELRLALPPETISRAPRSQPETAFAAGPSMRSDTGSENGSGTLPTNQTPGNQMARKTGRPVQLVSLPQDTFFVIPAGVAHSDGQLPHWEGPHPEQAFSRILWILALPAGALCHICTTQGTRHFSNCPLFVHDPHLFSAADLIVDELRARRLNSEVASEAQLRFLLLRLERGLQTQKPLPTGKGIRLFPAEAGLDVPTVEAQDGATHPVLEIACAYIRTHLEEPLSPAQIAAHANISVSHLNRIFRARMQLSVMAFVTRCRLEMARSLLENSTLTMAEISRLTGFYDAAHFNHAFTAADGETPTQYRRRFRSQAAKMSV